MDKGPIIQYDTAELRQQWDTSAISVYNALKKITRTAYQKVTGLGENDPLELWRFAVGIIEAPPDLRKNKTAKALVQRFRQRDPQFAGDPEAYHRFRQNLGRPTLRDTVEALAHRSHTDAELANQLSKLLAIYRHGPIPQAVLEEYGLYAKDAQLLLLNWVNEPFGNITASFAFYSDRAMAKMLWQLSRGQWLPSTRLTSEPERLRKLYGGLGLVPAEQRAIRDISLKGGRIHFDLFKTATPNGR